MKLGRGFLGFGAEKNDESDFAAVTSLTADFASFFTTVAFFVDDGVGAGFFVGTAFADATRSSAFRFLALVSA